MVVLGADPEFEVIQNGRLVHAGDVVRATRLPWGEIGVDGAGVALELRPNPGDVDELVVNVAKLIVAAPAVCRGTPTTIGVGHPLGGHVHFGVPDDTDHEELVRVVDDALGPLLRAMNGPARDKSRYGKRRDWRFQPWGVEYRTPPATIWAHPEVARGFLSAMLTLVLSGGREMTPTYEELVELAAFAIEHGRKLHYGAWKRVADEVCPVRQLELVYTHTTERDDQFEGDLVAALAPLGTISRVVIFPLHKKRGDFASNLPGFGEMAEGVWRASYEAGALYVALSWRFRNDREFRVMAMPAFIEAALRLIWNANEPELEVVVVEPVEPTASEDAKERVKKAAEEERAAPAPTPPIATEEEDEDDEYVVCHRCDERIHVDDALYDRRDYPFCPECYHEIYTSCERCECEVHRDDAYYPSTGRYDGEPLCRECYVEIYSECARCAEEIDVEDAIVPTSGRYSGDLMCGECYEGWYTRCDECGGEVEWHRAHRENGMTLCGRCVEEVE